MRPRLPACDSTPGVEPCCPLRPIPMASILVALALLALLASNVAAFVLISRLRAALDSDACRVRELELELHQLRPPGA